MSFGGRDTLRARMAERLDAELIGRARARLAAKAAAGAAEPPPGAPPENPAAQLAHDVWQLAAAALRMPPAELSPRENLANLGIDSIAITEIMAQISRHFGISVAPTVFFEAKHLDDLGAILFERYGKTIAARSADRPPAGSEATPALDPSPASSPTLPASGRRTSEAWIARQRKAAGSGRGLPVVAALAAVSAPSAAAPAFALGGSGKDVPIAILSMEGKFPRSPDLDAFEAHLRAGDDCIEEIPPERWDWRAVHGDPKKGAFTDVRFGGFVPDADQFDAGFFNISPREAELIDPQHRLFMECVWSLVEKGGYAPGALSGRKIGMFLGINLLDYTDMVNRAGIMEAQQLTGLGHAFCPNRLSFLLDIHGPSEVVDTACSSSLVAIHRALMSIRHEGCEMAIAGGSNLMLSPTQHIMFSKVGMITPDGRCKSFSRDANGYARADGVGAVLLKRLDLAERDGDPILGVIRGSVAHHGGGATSLTAPNPKSQARLIVEAHRQAGVDPRSIGMVECHGTGTPLGDPIEIDGLKRAFAELYRDRDLVPAAEPTIGLGSVKSNIGHAETAAGIAGLIKVLLAMRSETLHPTLHCEAPNPVLELAGSPFFLVTEAGPWRRAVIDGREQPLRAGLSSFGAGGTNVHMVIEEYRRPAEAPPVPREGPFLFPVSAKNEPALRAVVARLREAATTADLADMAATLQVGRNAMRWRLCFVAAERATLVRAMDAFLAQAPDAAAVGTVPAGQQVAALDPRAEPPATIAAYWTAGGAVDWLALYAGRRPHRIALPSYAFQRQRYWLPLPESPISRSAPVTLTPEPLGGDRFELRLTGEETFLADHRVGGTPVLPGVAYLELARAAAEQAGFSAPTLRQIVWMTPLKVQRPVTVVCEIARLPEGGRVEIVSVSESGERSVHAQMRIAASTGIRPRQVDLQGLRRTSARPRPAAEIYAAFDALGLAYGDGHRVIRELATGGDAEGRAQVLAELELPAALHAGMSGFVLHPSLLDGALQSAIGLAEPGDGATALPFSIDAVEMFGPCEPHMWALVGAVDETRPGVRAMDIDLLADDGSVRAAIRGFVTRRLAVSASAPTGDAAGEGALLCFEPCWRPLVPGSTPPAFERRIVLLSGVRGGESAWRSAIPGHETIVFDDHASSPPGETFERMALRFVEAVQLLLREPGTNPLLVQMVCVGEANPPHLAGLAGMMRSLGREHRRVHGQVVAFTGIDPSALATALQLAERAPAGALLRAEGPGLALEGWEEKPAAEAPPTPWRDGGVYLVTGGAGKLGRMLASEILRTAPQARVILASRHEPSAELAMRLREGRGLHHRIADVADAASVSALVEGIRRDHGGLDGTVHAAGVLRDESFLRQTPAQLRAVLAPKVRGVIALDDALGNTPLDFFLLFSSIAAVTGNVGQAAYAAANGFLDGFALSREARRQRGERHGRTLSIAWPLWREGGMRLDPAEAQLMRRVTGLAPMDSATGLAMISAGLAGASSRLLVASGDAEKIRRFVAVSPERPDLAETDNGARAGDRGPLAPIAIFPDARTLYRPILDALVREASAQLKVTADDLETDVELTEYGFDSIGFTQFANRLNERFGLELTPTLFFEHPTLEGIGRHLAEEAGEAMAKALGVKVATAPVVASAAEPQPSRQPEAAAPVWAANDAAPSQEGHRAAGGTPSAIAIIGMSGQFPGAPDVDAFWEVLAEGRDCIGEVPAERWDWRDYFGDPLSEPGRGNVRWGGFIDGMAAFDAPFFGISAPEARMMDPQQRLLLTEAFRVMEDAGYAPSALAGSRTGVFVGTADTGYSRLLSQAEVAIEGYSMTGLAPSLGPNRISYFYDFHGPSVAVETACSSALVAVHRAVEAIRSGHCTAAIAGGINALLLPEAFVGFSKAGMLSPGGRCKPFSAEADGYARGEGVGLVFLKPLAAAEADGDRILAVIRASAENHGGRAASLTAPNPRAQADLLRTAYAAAGFDPRTVGYIEAHGTGTPLGDPIEVEALTSAFADLTRDAEAIFGPAPAQSCAIGSVKSNIGHLELAAGIAGLIKVLLQFRHGTIAPTLHCDALNPYLKLGAGPFHVARQRTDWTAPVDARGEELPRRAGVSSFGFGGSNAHLVLEEYRPPAPPPARDACAAGPSLVILSARSEPQLREMAERLLAFLAEPGRRVSLTDLAHTLQTARDAMEFRLGFVASSLAELPDRLSAYLGAGPREGLHVGRAKAGRRTMALLQSDDALRLAAAGLVDRGRPDDLLALWVDGFNVDWGSISRNGGARRISLPGYPFAQTRYWVTPTAIRADRSGEARKVGVEGAVSAFSFDGSESFLRDHRVQGAKVLPGVMSLEMLRVAIGGSAEGFELLGHRWVEPVSVGAGPVRLSVVLEGDTSDISRYLVFAESDAGGRRLHAEGKVRRLGPGDAPRIGLDQARGAATREMDVAAIYSRFDAMGLNYGPAQRAIGRLWQEPGIVVARLEVPAEADGGFGLDPSLLDGALQAMLGFDRPVGDGLALPSSVRRIAVYGATTPGMWAVLRAGDAGPSIDVCRDDGTVAVRFEDFVVARPAGRMGLGAAGDTGHAASRPSGTGPVILESDEDPSARALRLLTGIAARTLEVEASALDPETELGDYGFDSVTMTAFAARINAELGLSLATPDFFEFATLARLAGHVAADLKPARPSDDARRTLDRPERKAEGDRAVGADRRDATRSDREAPAAPAEDPIVITGQSCCFPMAGDADTFWSNLIAGRDCIGPVPADRWSWQAIDGDPKSEPGKTNIHRGGFIDGVFAFDPLFFGISPREARLMDPQQRLMLMHAWKAIEDAGHSPRSLAGQKVGVFVGTASSGYQGGQGADLEGEGYLATGSVASVGPNRISYFLDLHGPSEPVETACSSSLVALHRAVQAIRAGDCDMALVGGVNSIVTPEAHITFAKAGMLAPDGRCKTFSAAADGYGRGEGVGMILVRRQSDAERDGDPILAVVRASGINHGGRAQSLTAPNTSAQADLLRDVYRKAGIDPRTIGYIEAHGTGTPLGDPVEINALKSAFRALPETADALVSAGCKLGSVKTAIGHLELAAGIAGVIKVLKQIEHRQLAPSLHCEAINPLIDLTGSPFEIVRSAQTWAPVRDAAGHALPLRAGISSFGFGGVNAHVVLEEYRAPQGVRPAPLAPERPSIVILSARDGDRLGESARHLLAALDKAELGDAHLGDLAYTLQIGRAALPERLAIVASTIAALRDRLGDFVAGEGGAGVFSGRAADRADATADVLNPRAVAQHWVRGGTVDWIALDPGPHRRLRLPTYPFARDVYRLDGVTAAKDRDAQPSATPALSAGRREPTVFLLQADAFYLRDHVVRGEKILPGAMSLELACRAVAERAVSDGDDRSDAAADGVALSDIVWRRPLRLNLGERSVRVDVGDAGSDGRPFRLVGTDDAREAFVTGVIPAALPGRPPRMDVEAVQGRCRVIHDPDWLYASYAALGIDYGPTFRAVADLTSGDGEVLARLRLPRAAEADRAGFRLHPAMLDAAFHAAMVAFAHEGVSELALPFGIARLSVFGPTADALWAHIRTVPSGEGIRKLDIDLADDAGTVLVRIEGFSLRRLAGRPPAETADRAEAAPAAGEGAARSAAERYFVGLVAHESGVDPAAVSLSAPLEDHGIDSVMITRLTDRLEIDFGPLSRTLFFEYQTLSALVGHFQERHGERLAALLGLSATTAARPLPARAAAAGTVVRTERVATGADEPIAIIGVAGRYPGANTLPAFWENLAAGRDSITEVPGDRWDHGRYFDPVRQPGKTTSRWGGFVEGHDRFDPLFFNIAPREAAFIDPQERLFLQCAWETLEDAGYTRANVAPGSGDMPGGDVGVFVGVMYEEYQLYGPERTAQGQPVAMTGSAASIANRVSYFCDFHGPSLAVDSMCSSSLTALHLACDALRAGSCQVALAGGVNLTLHPNKYIALSQGRFLSSKGRCESFGEGGDGYVPAEGVGAVLLKPLWQAEADGDRIHAVILGSALNHGGKTNGYTVPNPSAQAAVVGRAMEKAGVSPVAISYVEAHGTGTSLGDPIEIAALARAYGCGGEAGPPCAIGSVKSNIGHAESAAGMAGLTKVLLQLKHGQLVPSLHAAVGNPHIAWDATPFRVQQRLQPWDRRERDGVTLPRMAGLSSFGAGGSNAHFILSEYPPAEERPVHAGPEIYPFSARDPERLVALLANFRSALEDLNESDLPSLAFVLQEGREAFEERLAIVAADRDELTARLDLFLAGRAAGPGIYRAGVVRPRPPAILGDSLGDIASGWVQGAVVDWTARRNGPRPRAISLPTYPFAADRCWLPDLDDGFRPAPAVTAPPMPLLFAPAWRETAARQTSAPTGATRLIVLCGLAAEAARLDRASDEAVDLVVLEAPAGTLDERYGFYAARLMDCLQGLIRQGMAAAIVQVVVPATGADSCLEGLGGMLRCAAMEHRAVSCQIIAVDARLGDLPTLLAADAAQSGSDRDVRYSEGRRLVRTWQEIDGRDGAVASPWKDGGRYLLTGGAGGIGLLVAESIAAAGGRPSLWLTGRSALDPLARQRIVRMEEAGATVRHRRVDVTDRAAVAALVREIDAEDGGLDGLFHGAGLARDGRLLTKDEATLHAVLAPKVTGIRILDEVLGDRPLDFVALFASAAGAVGNPGQSDYAAANAFLDRFAIERNARVAEGSRRGRTVAMDWPYWRDGGMHMAGATIAALERDTGVAPLDTAAALATLGTILTSVAAPQVLVLAGDHDRLRRMMGPAEPAAGGRPAAPVAASTASAAIHGETMRADEGRAAIVATIRACFSSILGIPVDRLAPDATIDRFGVDSVSALDITAALSAAFGALPSTLLFEFPTIDRLADEVLARQGAAVCDGPAVPVPTASQPGPSSAAAAPNVPAALDAGRDIAVIAVAGRYPGADTIEAFAEVLREGRDCVTEIPPDRADLVARFSERKGEPGASICRWGGFLSDVDRFDAGFFGYSPRAADLADPQERLFLETAWHLFERAGHTRAQLAEHYESRVGVFVGAMYQQYPALAADAESRALLSLSSYSGIANRVSFFFDLQGPSVAVDSMCSSGLQAVHQACQSLHTGECRLAVAGGVNLSIHPAKYEALSRAGLVGSHVGSRAFSDGDGYLPAEGVGAVLLKPLRDALRDGDRVLAVIKGSLASHSGHSAGYAVPSVDAQLRLLGDGFSAAGIDPASIGYVEAAANGSKLGDAVELRALSAFFSALPPGAPPIAIGSVKTNIGHAEAASGLAQLTKVLLQFEQRSLFPCPALASPEATKAFSGTPFAPQTMLAAWEAPLEDGATGKRRATVSAFGAGGSNVHLILEEPPTAQAPPKAERARRLFPLSATTPVQLAALRRLLADHLRARPGLCLAALSNTLRSGREAFAFGIDFVASDQEELVAKLEEADHRESAAALAGVVAGGEPDPGMLVLPGYPFARERHWLSPARAEALGSRASETTAPAEGLAQADPDLPRGRETALQLIQRTLAAELGCAPGDIDPQSGFSALGIDSMIRMRLIYAVEERCGVILDQGTLEALQTPQALADHLDADGPSAAVAARPAVSHPAVAADDTVPLGENQKGLWVLQKLFTERGDYNVPLAFRCRSVDRDALDKALGWLLAEHKLLGTRVVDGERLALSARPIPPAIRSLALPKDADTDAFLRQRALVPFDLGEGVLRAEHLSGGTLAAGESILLLVVHHLVTDGVSSAVITRRFWAAYDHFATGAPLPQTDRDAADYAAFVAWEEEFVGSQRGQAQKAYWLEKLAGPLPQLNLPSENPAFESNSVAVPSRELRLSAALTAALRTMAARRGCGAVSLYLGAFAALLYRYTGERDIVIGVPTLRRPQRRFADTVGYCANMIALRLAVDPGRSFGDFADSVQAALSEGLDNGDFPFAAIARERGGTATGEPPYQVTFAYQNFGFAPADLAPFARGEVSHLRQIRQGGDAALGFEVQDDAAGALIVATYDGSCSSAARIDRLLEHFRQLLEAASADETTPLSGLAMLTLPEVERALHHWSRSGRLAGFTLPVHEQIFARARQKPSATAIVCGTESLSYGDLMVRVRLVAGALRRRKVASGDAVGVLLGHEPDAIAALLGVMSVGAVWVPLDPAHPDERLRFMLGDAGVSVGVSRGALAERLRGCGDASIIDLDRERPALRDRFVKPLVTGIDPASPAYIIYTSGSTGVPKGVVVSHAAIAEHCQAIVPEYRLVPSDAVLQFAPCAVDTAIEQILPTLAVGARLVLRPGSLLTPGACLAFLAEMKVTVADLPPVYLHELLLSWERARADLGGLALRLVLVGGEALAPEVVAAWGRSGLATVRLINAYGPTEATVTALVHTVRLDGRERNTPIGRPLPGTEIYILDGDGHLVSDGVVGELHIGGARLAIGYHRRPDLTAEKFRPHRLGDRSVRLYATGDRASFRPKSGGVVEFHGRADAQVKIRGHRIELGEIEAAILSCGVEEAAVLAETSGAGDPALTAYVAFARASFDRVSLQRSLAARLPAAMVPARWVRLDRLPTTSSGKIDRRALKASGDAKARVTVAADAVPGVGDRLHDGMEARLLAIWRETLGLALSPEAIGMDDDFADVGGNSLLAVRLLGRIQEGFGAALSVADLGRATTIASQARLLRQRGCRAGRDAGDRVGDAHAGDATRLVPLWRPDASPAGEAARPLFLVHAIMGTLTCYDALLETLKATRPVYGLQAAGLEAGEAPGARSVEALAARYCRHVRRVQPEGPYSLGGWSFGGVVAFEMARQLVREGAAVSFLGLIDSYLPDEATVPDGLDSPSDSGDAAARQRRAFFRDLFGTAIAAPAEQDIVAAVRSLPQAASVLPNAGPDQIRRLFAVFAAHHDAFSAYAPGPCPAPVTLVRAVGASSGRDFAEGWRRLATGGLAVHRVAGDHDGILRQPALDAWMPILRAGLEEVSGP
jgi:amino acid adenylation domain-containing protein